MKFFYIILFKIIFLYFFSNNLYALEEKNCENVKDIMCIDIVKPIPNTSLINSNNVSRFIITQDEFSENNFTDLKDVLNFVGLLDIVQSGPRGQQTSLFTRGTNSNHTLVLLNGLPINDQSTTNGAFDFGQDFLNNITVIEVYKGPAAAHFGPDAVGGAVNIVTAIDYQNKMSLSTTSGGMDIKGNYITQNKDWNINLKGGMHHSKSKSALADGTDKDGTSNKSFALNIEKHITNNWRFWSTTFGRNTYADLDGHSLALQDGYNSNNTLYAQQIGFDHKTAKTSSFITLHTHAHDREYKSPGDEIDNYQSNAYIVRTEHKKIQSEKLSWGIGAEYKNDIANFQNRGLYNSTLDSNYNTLGFFGNAGYYFTDTLVGALHLRKDTNSTVGANNNTKIVIQKNNFLRNLNIRTTYSTAYKTPSLYELYGADNFGYSGNRNLKPEESKSFEVSADYKLDTNSMITVSFFDSNINNLIEYSNSTYVNSNSTANQSGLELSYSNITDVQSLKLFATSLSSEKADGSAQLRRPELSIGTNFMKKLDNDYKFIAKYKFTGQYFDTHNSNFATISMSEIHLLDVGVKKNFGAYELGLNISNLLNEDYQKPHGFSQERRKLYFGLEKKI